MSDRTAILAALYAWIVQRPRLEYGNYGDAAAYRSELRRIARQKNDALVMLSYVGTSIRHDDAARWTVVIDPPRGLRASILFAAECDAVRYAARVPHSYILPPRNMRES